MTGKKDDHEVGYGRPPIEYQFKKGTSGNPKGRPRNRNLVVADEGLADFMGRTIDGELLRVVNVLDNGRPKRMSAFQAMVRRATNGAIQGSPQDRRDIMKLAGDRAQKLPESPDRPFKILGGLPDDEP